MTFDLSHLYNTETITLGMLGGEIQTVTIREIPHGENVNLQNELMGKMSPSRDKKALDKQLDSIKFHATDFADKRSVAAIVSWTFKFADGSPAPVDLETWRKLPLSITKQIEEGISELNPDLDDEFQGESGS